MSLVPPLAVEICFGSGSCCPLSTPGSLSPLSSTGRLDFTEDPEKHQQRAMCSVGGFTGRSRRCKGLPFSKGCVTISILNQARLRAFGSPYFPRAVFPITKCSRLGQKIIYTGHKAGGEAGGPGQLGEAGSPSFPVEPRRRNL